MSDSSLSLHPDLRTGTADLPELHLFADIAATRASMAENPPRCPGGGLLVEDRVITGPTGGPLTVRIYRARQGPGDQLRPAIVWCHGGGFVLGDLGTEDAHCRRTARELDAVVVSVDYRLAPEHPYPAGFDDCWWATEWAIAHAGELSIDRTRVAVAGHSSGAAMAFGLAVKSRDLGSPEICYVFMGYPVVDDRLDTGCRSCPEDARFFGRDDCVDMWSLYLGGDDPAEALYAVPGRVVDLAGLPPIYVMIGALDPSRDAVLGWVQRLTSAGVSVELHLVPGAPHMFDLYGSGTPLVDRAVTNWSSALGAALHPEDAVSVHTLGGSSGGRGRS